MISPPAIACLCSCVSCVWAWIAEPFVGCPPPCNGPGSTKGWILFWFSHLPLFLCPMLCVWRQDLYNINQRSLLSQVSHTQENILGTRMHSVAFTFLFFFFQTKQTKKCSWKILTNLFLHNVEISKWDLPLDLAACPCSPSPISKMLLSVLRLYA